MSLYFEELDYRPTPMGALSLRRRRELSMGVDVFEIKLGDDYLMSSLFTASETALARLALAELPGADLDVVVGGLGLGYTCVYRKLDSAIAVMEAAQDWPRGNGAAALDLTMKRGVLLQRSMCPHYDRRRKRRGPGADAPHRTRSCGRGIPVGSSR